MRIRHNKQPIRDSRKTSCPRIALGPERLRKTQRTGEHEVNRKDRRPPVSGGTRVALIDLLHAQRRCGSVFGPMPVPTVDEARNRLYAMAAAGPALRLGLRPSAHHIHWQTAPPATAVSVAPQWISPGRIPPEWFSPESVATESDAQSACTQSIADRGRIEPEGDPLALLESVRALPDAGLRVVCAGDLVAVDFSHGLGDVAFTQAVVDAMIGGLTMSDAHWDRYRGTTRPLLAAAIHTFGRHPGRLASLGHSRRHRLPTDDADTQRAAPPEPGPGAPIPAGAGRPPSAATVRIPAIEMRLLRDARDRDLPGVSMFAVLTCALVRALLDAGIDLDPAVTIPFDLRPYLPAGTDTLAPLSAGLTFRVTADTAARTLTQMLDVASRSGRPVATMTIGTMGEWTSRLARRHPPAPDSSLPRAQLLHSSVGRLPQTAHTRFTDPARAVNYTVSDPATPPGITVTSSTVGGALCVTAAFYPEYSDATAVRAALAALPGHVSTTLHRK